VVSIGVYKEGVAPMVLLNSRRTAWTSGGTKIIEFNYNLTSVRDIGFFVEDFIDQETSDGLIEATWVRDL